MKKDYLTKREKDEDLSSFVDKVNKRFKLESQKDVDQLHGKIRRLSGRDELRKEAIKIVVKKRLNLSEALLQPWEDKESVIVDDNSTENITEETATMSEVNFRYIPKKERDAIKDSDFGYVSSDGKRRLFPVLDQETLDAAAKLIGRAKGLSDADREAVKKKLLAIARRKKLYPPKAWVTDTKISDTVTIG